MASVNGVSSTANTTATTSARNPSADLGINEFLELLAVQLSNQDPLEPMEDTDFIAQMAQFNSLQQMTALNASFSSTQAYSLVGKDVAANAKIDGVTTQLYGKVSGVINKSGTQYLQIGDHMVSLDSVQAVYNDTAIDNTITQAGSLVGKTITAEVPDSTGESYTTVQGEVSSVLVKGGALYVKCVDMDTEVPVAYIKKIEG